MKNLIAHRKPTRWITLLTFFISLTFMLVWLPFIRSIFDGASYSWGTGYFGFMIHGKGVTPSFVFLVVQLLFYAALMFSIYWSENRNVFYLLLGVWFINVFGNLLFDIIVNGDTMFHGDTLNIHVSLTAIIVPLSIVMLLLIGVIIKADIAAESVSVPWNRKNMIMAGIILGPLPIQAFLLAGGEPHGITDQVGVIMLILQCFLIPYIMRPYRTYNQVVKQA